MPKAGLLLKAENCGLLFKEDSRLTSKIKEWLG
jgi:hypothetical protein